MTLQYSATVLNAKLDAIESTIGTAPLLKFYTGSEPANCAATVTGTLLASQALPSDWMANASGGAKVKAGTWSGTFSASGTVGYFRVYDSTGTTCHCQGSVTITGSGGDMTMDNPVAASAQAWTANTFTLTSANA